MNERIKELIKQATEHDYTTWDSYNQKELVYYKFNQEKFAELIVKECVREIGYKSVELLDIDFYPHYQERLKKHFGVRE